MLVIINTGNHAKGQHALAKVGRGNANRHHRIKAIILQRRNINAAQIRIAIRMRMHAAHAAQTACATSALHRRQLYALVIAHRNSEHLTAAAQINGNLAVDKIRHVRHAHCQLRIQQRAALDTDIIKRL